MLTFLSVAGGVLVFMTTVGAIATYEAVRYPISKIFRDEDSCARVGNPAAVKNYLDKFNSDGTRRY